MLIVSSYLKSRAGPVGYRMMEAVRRMSRCIGKAATVLENEMKKIWRKQQCKLESRDSCAIQ